MNRSQNFNPGMYKALVSILRPAGVLPTLTFVLLLSIGTAWSYDANVSHETNTHQGKPNSVSAEQCLPLLNTHNTLKNSAKDRNQRAVGQVAALGIILGARFALEPENKNADLLTNKAKNNIYTDSAKDRTAHTIINYRQCLKQVALGRSAGKNDV